MGGARPVVKFISPSFFKENTTVDENVDDDIIVPFIIKAQNLHIQQALGSAFYNRLKEGVANNNLNADEEDFLRDYIQPCLVEYTLYELIPHINYKLTNKAISQKSSEFSQASTLDEVKYLRQSVRDLAEFYMKRIQRFLCDFGTKKFPIYANPGSNENLKRKKRSYFGGVYLPKKTWYEGWDLDVSDDPNVPNL
jgi:hypothetical protein